MVKKNRKAGIPTILRLAQLRRGERVLDVGCGQGVLAPHVLAAKGSYLGVDASPRLLALAQKFHGEEARFVLGDSRDLLAVAGVSPESFDVAVFMLSIQDMDPLDGVVGSVSSVLRPNGRLVIFMTHPCFRVPRRSGWGYDRSRKLTYRRVDSYLSESGVPMKAYSDVTPHARGATLSFHRALTTYVNTLARYGLTVDHLDELADPLAG
ncbi:MAG: methyltransferase [Trueperaceae bacterium]